MTRGAWGGKLLEEISPLNSKGLCMKVLFFGLLLAALAVGCSGSSTGGPIGTPPTPQPVAYQAQLVFKGPLAGSQSGISTLSTGREIQSMNQRGILSAPGATPVPIMVLSPNAPGTVLGAPQGSFGGIVEVVVSPAPSASPQVAFSQTNANAAISPAPTPQPGQTPFPYGANVVAVADVTGGSTVNAQSAGSATATITSPVNTAPTTQVFAYQVISVNCLLQSPGDAAGFAWNGSTWTPETTIAASDVYNTDASSGCAAPFDSGTTAVLNFPYGAVALSDAIPFSSLIASQWSNSFTSISCASLMAPNPDGSINATILFKTANGSIAKLFPNSVGGNSIQCSLGGAVEVSGSSIDSF